jgi:hypothetical protein
MKLFYAEVYFKSHFTPYYIHKGGFNSDIPCLSSAYLFGDRFELEDAITRAKDECEGENIAKIVVECVDLTECRECGIEHLPEDIMDSGECYPCFHAAAMGGSE